MKIDGNEIIYNVTDLSLEGFMFHIFSQDCVDRSEIFVKYFTLLQLFQLLYPESYLVLIKKILEAYLKFCLG